MIELCFCSHHDLENLLSGIKHKIGLLPPILNIKISAQFWKNTMHVIGLRTVPTGTEVSVPMDMTTARPCFTRGFQGSVCRNAFPLLLTL